MAKIIFFVLIGVFIYWRLRNHRSPLTPPGVNTKPIEDMVRCGHCGVYLPRSEAVGSQAAWFCSNAHQREHRP